MEQVQKELETNEDLRKSMKEFQESEFLEKSNRAAQTLSEGFRAAQASVAAASAKAAHSAAQTRQLLDRLAKSSQLGKILSPALATLLRSASNGSRMAVVALNGIFTLFADDKADRTMQRLRSWRLKQQPDPEQDSHAAAGDDAQTRKDHTSADLSGEEGGTVTDALILSHASAWDRFGTKLRDMPVLHNFFENPIIGKIFGETAQAAAVKEVKAFDSSFKLHHLCELAEFVIAPQLLQWFLTGDRAMLKVHCGQAAFAAASRSLTEREAMKLTLDPTVLWLREVDFRGAIQVPDSLPWFIFTFTAQQINCLRDVSQKVVLGAPDDIREVVYSIALTPHTEPSTSGLQFPWKIAEFAIVGNVPCW